MSHIMLIGIQGSGKGTQARKILEHSDNYTLFEMGTELRKFAQSGTPEGEETRRCIEAGLKAPTSAVVKMAELYVTTNKDKKILLDGVIRSQEQNTALEPVFGDFIVIYLDLDQETAVKRLAGRRIDPVTHETFPASFKGETNPKTGNTLTVRADDTEDAIRSRISWSIADTLPLIQTWEANGHQIYRIDASQGEEDIFAEIERVIQKKNSKVGFCGISYDPDLIATVRAQVGLSPDRERSMFFAHKMRTDLIYHTAALEGNPYTFPEVQTLLDGITVGGHKISDTEQILHLDRAWTELMHQIQGGVFVFDRDTFCSFQRLIAEREALKSGIFRDGGVFISGTTYHPPLHTELDTLFEQGSLYLSRIDDPILLAFLVFLWGSRTQFFYDGNKRTSRMMASGILLSAGFPPLHILSGDQLTYNRYMIDFYTSGDATPTLIWLMEYYSTRMREMGYLI